MAKDEERAIILTAKYGGFLSIAFPPPWIRRPGNWAFLHSFYSKRKSRVKEAARPENPRVFAQPCVVNGIKLLMNNAVILKIEALRSEFLEWFAKYRRDNPGKNPDITGFNMPYSVCGTWDICNDTLLLTINPKAEDSEPDQIPKETWPEMNELLNTQFGTRSKFDKAISQVAQALGDTREKAASDYAMWSVVPYRSSNAEKVPDELWKKAVREVWNPIFGLWLPSRIFVFGKTAHGVIRETLLKRAALQQPEQERQNPGKAPDFMHSLFKSPAGKTVRLFRMPHPSQWSRFYTGERSQALEFIRDMYAGK